MNEPKDLFALYEEANELRRKLAQMEAAIRRAENELWSKHQAERDAAIRAQDDRQSIGAPHRLLVWRDPLTGGPCLVGGGGAGEPLDRTAPPSAALGSVEHGSGG